LAGLKKNKPLKLLEQNDSRHGLAESYRNLRSSLLAKGRNGGRAKTILVTSAVPNEGKSTVAINLARILAFSGNKVLLIDADLRTGELHKLLDLPGELGLSQLEAQNDDFGRLLIPTALPNLSFLSRGKISDRAGELFVSRNLDSFLARISQEFDCVVLDSAPVFAAADTPSLAPKVDGVLFVIRDFFTRTRLAREALDQLYERNANVLGIVFNRASSSSRGYPYFKYPKYSAAPARV
jgi:capsular exopolysaccharide synthesis family protein